MPLSGRWCRCSLLHLLHLLHLLQTLSVIVLLQLRQKGLAIDCSRCG